MEARIAKLCDTYRYDGEALAALDQLAQEPAMHRRHSGCYACEFFWRAEETEKSGVTGAAPHSDAGAPGGRMAG